MYDGQRKNGWNLERREGYRRKRMLITQFSFLLVTGVTKTCGDREILGQVENTMREHSECFTILLKVGAISLYVTMNNTLLTPIEIVDYLRSG